MRRDSGESATENRRDSRESVPPAREESPETQNDVQEPSDSVGEQADPEILMGKVGGGKPPAYLLLLDDLEPATRFDLLIGGNFHLAVTKVTLGIVDLTVELQVGVAVGFAHVGSGSYRYLSSLAVHGSGMHG
jgi:hypothetical protein